MEGSVPNYADSFGGQAIAATDPEKGYKYLFPQANGMAGAMPSKVARYQYKMEGSVPNYATDLPK